jgi:hypothetical protein
VEDLRGQRDRGEDCGWIDHPIVESRPMGDNRHAVCLAVERRLATRLERRQKILHFHMLRVENAIDRFFGETAPIAEEVGYMGLTETGLSRQERDTEGAALNSVHQRSTKPFVHLGEGHLWIVRY